MAEAKKNYVHSLRVYLVGGQTFTLYASTRSASEYTEFHPVAVSSKSL